LIAEYEDFLGHEIMHWDWRFASASIMHPFDHSFGEKDVIANVKLTYRKMGIELDKLPIQITESLATQTTMGYYSRIPHDILLSYGPLQGFQKPFFLLHALGRACCFAHIDESLAYPFRRSSSMVLSEGIGNLASWVMWEPDWLKEFTDLTTEQIEGFVQQMKKYEIFKTRYHAGLALFELDAYAALAEDSEADLEAIHARHMEQFLLLPKDDCSVWAAEPWFIRPFPDFIKKILGMAVSANLQEYFRRRGTPLFSPHFSELLHSDLVRLGNVSSWPERLQKLTSNPLAPLPMSWTRI
jgi:hypothetical protein